MCCVSVCTWCVCMACVCVYVCVCACMWVCLCPQCTYVNTYLYVYTIYIRNMHMFAMIIIH